MRDEAAAVEALHAALLEAGESLPACREVLDRLAPEENVLRALLRRSVPLRLLEFLGTTPPWSERPRLLAAIVLNRRAPLSLAQRILPALYWHDLAEVAASPWLQQAVRARAEGLLADQLPDLRLGDRTALARIATRPLLRLLLADADVRVVEVALVNPRLHEDDLLAALRASTVTEVLIASIAESYRWRDRYAVRLGLALQRRTPLALALAQLQGLVPRDLQRVAETGELRPLVRAAAERRLEAVRP